MPRRIQRRRTKGWRLPANAVVVDRTSRWGNPFRVVKGSGGTWLVTAPSGSGLRCGTRREANQAAVNAYRSWLAARPDLVGTARRELTGRDLACWCPLDQPCHGDVLLRLANGEVSWG